MKRHAGMLLAIGLSSAFGQSGGKLIEAPQFWNDRDLSDWATPVAGLNVRPGHYSEKEYYAAPVGELVRTYPVYFPGREPAGYRDMLRQAKPEPLLTPGARTLADWVKEGRRVFHEMDIPYLRSYDPKLAEILRSADEFKKMVGHPQKDSTVSALRWVPTAKGLALGIQDCATCHSRVMPDGSILDGAPGNDSGGGVFGSFVRHDSPGFLEFFSPGETRDIVAWRLLAAPYAPNYINARFKSTTPPDPR